MDYRQHLLRTDEEVERFRLNNADFIERYESRYEDWIGSLPLCVKVPYLTRIPEHAVPMVIGLICFLHDSGRVNIQFNEGCALISRQPASTEEWELWCDERERPLRKYR